VPAWTGSGALEQLRAGLAAGLAGDGCQQVDTFALEEYLSQLRASLRTRLEETSRILAEARRVLIATAG